MGVETRSTASVVFLILSVCVSSIALSEVTKERIGLKITKQVSCRRYKDGNNGYNMPKQLIFFTDKKAELEEDGEEEGCYFLDGTVNVINRIKQEKLKLYISISYSKETQEQCYGYNKTTNCGGTGSCLHCDICESEKELKRLNLKIGAPSLLLEGKKLKCSDEIPRKKGQKIKVKFCLPPVEEYLQAQNITRRSWNSLWETQGYNDRIRMTIKLLVLKDKQFNRKNIRHPPLQNLFGAVRKIESEFRAQHGMDESVPVPPQIADKTKLLNYILKEYTIGCHKLRGFIYKK